MGDKLEFTAGQLFALHTALGQGQAPNVAALAERLALYSLTDFTDVERTALHWQERPDGTALFSDGELVTRTLTETQRAQIAKHALSVAAGFPVPWVARWLVPALAVLGDTSLTEVRGGKN